MTERIRAERQRLLQPLGAIGSVVGVWASVGAGTALVAAVLSVVEFVWPGRRILAKAALIALILMPLLWFAGSDLPLSPPAVRIQDNALAHHVGGLAAWLMFLAVLFDPHESRRPREGVARDGGGAVIKEEAS